VAATQNGLIQAADYNSLQATVAKILGTTYDSANPNYNYGLTTQINSSQLVLTPTPPVVSATEWANLKLDILAAAAHQGTTGSISALVNQTLSSGSTINASDQTAFTNAITVIDTNRTKATTLTQYNPGLTNSRTTSWGSSSKTTVTHTFTLTWPDAASARYFFNLGSIIQFSASRADTPTAGSGTDQNVSWTNGLSLMGTVTYGVGGILTGYGSGTPSANVGWYDLTSTNKQIFTKTNMISSTNMYTANDYTISAKCNVASNSAGTANSITFTIDFKDDTKNQSVYDSVDGTLTSTISISKGTITDSSTLYTAPQPTATQGTLLAN
jgi:hypothetical protein